MGNRHFEYIKIGTFSDRTFLRDSNSGEILISCAHKTFKRIFYEKDNFILYQWIYVDKWKDLWFRLLIWTSFIVQFVLQHSHAIIKI